MWAPTPNLFLSMLLANSNLIVYHKSGMQIEKDTRSLTCKKYRFQIIKTAVCQSLTFLNKMWKGSQGQAAKEQAGQGGAAPEANLSLSRRVWRMEKNLKEGWIQNWDPDLLEHSMQQPRWHTGSVESLDGRTVLLARLHLGWNVWRWAVEAVNVGIEEDCAEIQAQWHTREM
ncbi:hypothetical protein C8J56DRAFT_900737 [Mycena floridula]|nr:hypothetical protein C8J56DRAFT_900737 [Mycena floridula]